MLTRCLFCNAEFSENRAVEHFPRARRIAFDSWRGRLWGVCTGCGRWTLAPFDTRLDALDELERLARDRGRVLASTANIALIRTGSLDLVRVGKAPLREEAWWRYGEEVLRRSARTRKLTNAGKIFDAALVGLIIGIPYWGWSKPQNWIDRARDYRFGRYAWRGGHACTRCGVRSPHITFDERLNIQLVNVEGEIGIRFPCARCGWKEAAGSLIVGSEARQLLRRTLAYHNYAGASQEAVQHAANRIEDAHSPHGLLHHFAEKRSPLGFLTDVEVLALEIAVNDETERVMLARELAALEARWREEEQIASIADGELTPLD